MAVSKHDKLSVAAFFEAIAGEDGRFELVDGVAYAMAGAKEGHNVIASNLVAALVPAGKRQGCRTTASDTAVQTGPHTIRYPDVVVDCGPPNAEALTASRPTIIVEISSPGTAVFDYGVKLKEYQSLDSVDTILQIESEIVLVKVHRRVGPAQWSEELYEDLDEVITLPLGSASISVQDIYDTLEVRPRVRLQIV